MVKHGLVTIWQFNPNFQQYISKWLLYMINYILIQTKSRSRDVFGFKAQGIADCQWFRGGDDPRTDDSIFASWGRGFAKQIVGKTVRRVLVCFSCFMEVLIKPFLFPKCKNMLNPNPHCFIDVSFCKASALARQMPSSSALRRLSERTQVALCQNLISQKISAWYKGMEKGYTVLNLQFWQVARARLKKPPVAEATWKAGSSTAVGYVFTCWFGKSTAQIWQSAWFPVLFHSQLTRWISSNTICRSEKNDKRHKWLVVARLFIFFDPYPSQLVFNRADPILEDALQIAGPKTGISLWNPKVFLQRPVFYQVFFMFFPSQRAVINGHKNYRYAGIVSSWNCWHCGSVW